MARAPEPFFFAGWPIITRPMPIVLHAANSLAVPTNTAIVNVMTARVHHIDFISLVVRRAALLRKANPFALSRARRRGPCE